MHGALQHDATGGPSGWQPRGSDAAVWHCFLLMPRPHPDALPLAPVQDVLPACDTPREALTTAALLRLPPTLSRAQKLRRVEQTLEVLELGDCADTLIGDASQGARGLSGGQRRRVTSAWWGGRAGCRHCLLAGSGCEPMRQHPSRVACQPS